MNNPIKWFVRYQTKNGTFRSGYFNSSSSAQYFAAALPYPSDVEIDTFCYCPECEALNLVGPDNDCECEGCGCLYDDFREIVESGKYFKNHSPDVMDLDPER